jgi:hypothetical protein
MICTPTFSPEYALILRSGLQRRGEDPFALDQSIKWTLEVANASKAIAFEDSRQILRLRKDVPVERKSIAINEQLALLVQQAWIAVLRLTRYPENTHYLGNDGEVYRFFADDRDAENVLYGETWCPQSGLPAEIVNLAKKLIDLIKANNSEKSRLTTECTAEAQKLIDNAKTAAAKATFNAPK